MGLEDDQQQQGFVSVEFKLLTGRTAEQQQQLATLLLQTLQDYLVPLQSGRVNVQLCVEVIDLSAVYKKQSLML